MKHKRHDKIIELINMYEIETQEDLVARLNEAGFNATQATVSRDIRELKLSKASVGGSVQKYILVNNSSAELGEKYRRALKDGLESIVPAMNMVVIKSFPGMAMSVAAAVDAMKIPELLGSIAGDDTIMCATDSIQSANIVVEKIKEVTRQ